MFDVRRRLAAISSKTAMLGIAAGLVVAAGLFTAALPGQQPAAANVESQIRARLLRPAAGSAIWARGPEPDMSPGLATRNAWRLAPRRGTAPESGVVALTPTPRSPSDPLFRDLSSGLRRQLSMRGG